MITQPVVNLEKLAQLREELRSQEERRVKSLTRPDTPPPPGPAHEGRVLIGVITCQQPAYLEKARAQKLTWVRDASCDVRFFTGPMLGTGDYYSSVKEKFIALVRWAWNEGYSYLWRVDDDVYLRPERLLAVGVRDYAGPTPYWIPKQSKRTGPLSGFSRRAMQVLLEPDRYPLTRPDDVWMLRQLADKDIEPFQLMDWCGWTHCHGELEVPQIFGGSYDWVPQPDNAVIASWEHTPQQLREIHSHFEISKLELSTRR